MYDYDFEIKAQLVQWNRSEEPRWDRIKIETEAVADTKKRVAVVFRGLEKTLA